MKSRIVATITTVVVVVVLAFVVGRFALMGDVAADDFSAFIRDHDSSEILAYQTSAASSLPLRVSLRFPESEQLKGGLGSPDRTDVYTIESNSGRFECHAHIRRERVCLVTFENSELPIEFREQLASEFPKLSVR